MCSISENIDFSVYMNPPTCLLYDLITIITVIQKMLGMIIREEYLR